MFGTIVNAAAIIAGGLTGVFLKRGIPQSYMDTVMQAISLAIILIGLRGAFGSDDILLIIFSLAIGSIIGELMRIDARLEDMGNRIQRRFAGGDEESTMAKGFVTASLIFCVGSMAIVGSLESGLTGNHQTLFAKSMLDGIAALIFASTFGIGVIFSAASVFIYQGFITISAALVKPFLTPEVIAQMSAVGGLLIMAIGINLLEIKKIRLANMLPAIFVPLVYYMVRQLF